MNIKCIIFDCDGLMFNTETVSIQVWLDFFEKYHINYPDNFFKRITGANSKSVSQTISEVPGLSEHIEEIRKERFKRIYQKAQIKDSLNMKGLTNLLSYLNKNDYKIAIASSSGYEYVTKLMDSVSTNPKIDTIVGGDMIKHSKPDPEIFLLAANILNVKPEQCIVIEDSKNGILAAKNANMPSIFIQDTVVPDEEMKSYIQYQLNDLDEVISFLQEHNK